MNNFLRRVVWGSVWIVAYAIIAYLCVELSDSQPVMLALLLLAAFVASVGLVYSRQSFIGGDWTVGTAALFVTGIALTVSVIGDISYWSGTLESAHEQVTRDRAVYEGQSLVMARQKERYSALAKGQSADALQAEMAAELARSIAGKSLGARTGNCTDTTSPHHKSCATYFDLKSRYHAASEAQKLETVVWSAGTTVEKPGRRRDFYRTAVAISEATGWKVENSILGITAAIVILLQALLMLSLYIAVSPQRKAKVARAASWDDDVAPKTARTPLQTRSALAPNPTLQKALAATAQPVARTETKEEEKPLSFQKPVLVRPAPVPVDKPREDALPIVRNLNLVVDNEPPKHFQPVVNFDREGNDDFPQKYRGKKAKGPSALAHSRQSASVRKWLGMCSTDNHKKTCANSDDVWAAYTAWLEATGEHGFTYRKAMIAELGRVYFKGGRNGRTSRNAKGPKFPGLIPYHPVVERQRARA